jgi:hypothetical protein
MTDKAKILEFCKRWLPAWTGNRPEVLLEFYTEDAFYQDPARPQGLRGHPEMRPYFEKLLAANPDWVWEVVEVFPTERGFTLKWRATIPVGREEVIEYGLDIVEWDGEKVTRNEVYFDRAKLLAALAKRRKQGSK